MIGWMDHMWNFWGMGWGMWFWILIIAGFSYLFYTSILQRTDRPTRDDPLEINRIRLARGEITQEEFERIKEILEGTK